MSSGMHCPECGSSDVDCDRKAHCCLSCGYDGLRRSSGVAQAAPGEAVEAERRQDQAEPCNSASLTKSGESG